MKKLLARLPKLPGLGSRSAGPVVEYLPDADEIERSPPPRIAQMTIWLVVGGLVAAGAWAALARLDQVVSATGRLVNPVPNVVVQPLETSIIQTVDVRAGQTVRHASLGWRSASTRTSRGWPPRRGRGCGRIAKDSR